MLTFSKSYIYTDIMDHGGSCTSKIQKVIQTIDDKIINDALAKSLTDMNRFYRDPLAVGILNEVKSGNIQLVALPVELQLPACIPFVKYRIKDRGGEKIYIDVSRYITTRKLGDIIELSIDLKKLYALCYSAYVTLKMTGDTLIVSSDVAKWSAYIWAKMFCKILNSAIGLSTDKDRYDAFMYFALKFFCLHYLELPVPMCNQIAEGLTPNFGSNYVIRNMQMVIDERQYPIFESIADFCKILFTEEVGNLRGLKIANVQDKMNISEYFKKYMTMYGPASVMSLGAYPYFLFTIMSANVQAMIVNDRSLKDIVKEDESKAMPKLIASIQKEILR